MSSSQLLNLKLNRHQSQTFEKFLSAVKEFLDESSLIFSPEGLTITEVDQNETVLVHAIVDLDQITQEYQCQNILEVRVKLPKIYQILHILTDNPIQLSLDTNQSEILLITTESSTKDSVKYNLLENEIDQEIVFPGLELDQHFHFQLSLSEFLKLTKMIKVLNSQKFQLTYLTKQKLIELSTLDGAHQFSSSYQLSHIPANITTSCQGIYSSQILTSLVHSAKLTDQVNFYFREEQPLYCQINISGFGELNYLISPCSLAE